MNFFRVTGIAAVCATLIACSSDSKDVAGSSLETENSIAFQVNFANGLAASKAYVIIHDDQFYVEDQDDINPGQYPQTNEDGILELDSLPRGKYVVEVRGFQGTQEQKGATAFEITQIDNDSGKVVTVQTGIPASFEGKAYTDKYPAWIMIRGLEYRVPVDSQGNFSFESLPEGVFEFVLVHSQTNSAGSTVSQILAESKLCVGCDGSETVTLVDKTAPPLDTASKDTATVDTSATDTIPKDTLKHFVFDDFENALDNGEIKDWYTAFSKHATGDLEITDTLSDRKGYVAHFKCQNDSLYNWTLMGRYLGGAVDMSELDSIVFWAKGTVENYVSFSFDIIEADTTADIQSGKSWMHIPLTEEWARYTVTPSSLLSVDSNNTGGNIGWDAVREHVTNISIFGGKGGEFWVDDIEVFGLESFTPKASSVKN